MVNFYISNNLIFQQVTTTCNSSVKKGVKKGIALDIVNIQSNEISDKKTDLLCYSGNELSDKKTDL
jgi:hypothetical protein